MAEGTMLLWRKDETDTWRVIQPEWMERDDYPGGDTLEVVSVTALAQERERVRELLKAEYDKATEMADERTQRLAAERQRDELMGARDAAIALLRRAADHEFKGTTAENGDAHKLVREALARIQHNPAASEGER